MKSADVKRNLKQLADFHLSLVQAGELLESYEAAERDLQTLDTDIAAKQSTIDQLARQLGDYQGKIGVAKQAFNEVMAGLEKQKEDKRAELKPLDDAIKERRLKLDQLNELENANRQQSEAERVKQQKILQGIVDEIARLKKQFAG
jgi:chromosome segregation ATPase